MSRTILILAAHPDDEVIGVGGTIARHAAMHDTVHVAVAAEGATSRDAVRDVLARQKAEGVGQKLCAFTLDKPLPLYGGEAVIHDGKVVGVTTSGNFSYTLGKSVAYAYLPAALCSAQGFAVESFTEQSPATRHDGPLYDPKNERLKG